MSGEARDKLSAAALKAVQSGTKFEQEYAVYPSKDLAPASYLDRRRKVAYAMYELQGVGRKDSLVSSTQHLNLPVLVNLAQREEPCWL